MVGPPGLRRSALRRQRRAPADDPLLTRGPICSAHRACRSVARALVLPVDREPRSRRASPVVDRSTRSCRVSIVGSLTRLVRRRRCRSGARVEAGTKQQRFGAVDRSRRRRGSVGRGGLADRSVGLAVIGVDRLVLVPVGPEQVGAEVPTTVFGVGTRADDTEGEADGFVGGGAQARPGPRRRPAPPTARRRVDVPARPPSSWCECSVTPGEPSAGRTG